MEKWRSLCEAVLLGLGFASIGAVAKAAKSAVSEGHSLRQFLRLLLFGLPVSSFAGVMVSLLIHDSGWAVTTQAAICGVAGLMGWQMVDLLVEVVSSMIKRQGQK